MQVIELAKDLRVSPEGLVHLLREEMEGAATLAVPLIAGYAYHKRGWESRQQRRWSRVLETAAVR